MSEYVLLYSQVLELDLTTYEWHFVGSMPDRVGKERAACGFVTTQRGRELLLAGEP